jgi:hypothetical protein
MFLTTRIAHRRHLSAAINCLGDNVPNPSHCQARLLMSLKKRCVPSSVSPKGTWAKSNPAPVLELCWRTINTRSGCEQSVNNLLPNTGQE